MGQALRKHPGGRPSKYNRAILDATYAYVTGQWKELGHKIPTIAGLALLLDTDRETVKIWASDENKKEFSVMVSKLMSMQEHELIDKGLDSVYNSGITKLILSKHGYSDTQQNQQAINITVNRGQTTVSKGQDSVTIEHDD